jgi:hypothetical protein
MVGEDESTCRELHRKSVQRDAAATATTATAIV